MSSCATGTIESVVHIDDRASSVKIYRRDDPPSACRELGEVGGISGTNSNGGSCVLGSRENAMARLKQAVAQMEGNAVLLEGKIKEPQTPISGSLQCVGATDWQYVVKGIAFHCPPGATE